MNKVKSKIIIVFFIILFAGCSQEKIYVEIKTGNPVFKPNTAFSSFENLTHPKFAALREKYQLDTIFHGETDELKRILLLRNWIRSIVPINDPGPHPGDGSPESILDHALKGNGYHCGHYMVVQNAVMNAYGYVTRCLGAGPGGADGVQNHHGIDEIWLNSYNKWFMSDAKYNSHFEKNGIPLSALEIRDEYLKNKAADIKRVKGINRVPIEYDEEYKMSKEHFARTYSWLEWDTYADKYVPDTSVKGDRGILTMFNDSFFKNNTWMWDGKPHWAYNTKFMNLIEDRDAIEWTPNTISSEVSVLQSNAVIKLKSNTPNLDSYQLKKSSAGDWENVPDSIQVALKNDTNEFLFRVINMAGVTGPEHKVIIAATALRDK